MKNQKIYNLQALNFLQNTSLKVGILGGSFNPAHIGHLSISMQALKYFQFDYIIWLVAHQNPLKISSGDIFLRANNAYAIANHPKIIISTAEHDLNCYYSYDSLNYLVKKFSGVKFTWLMGMDYLTDFRCWHRSDEIVKLCDIIFFDRPCNSRLININTLGFKALYFNDKAKLALSESNNIMIYRGRLCDISSTAIRNQF